MTVFFGFAIADSMFPDNCCARRHALTPEDAVERLKRGTAVPCVNPSHKATLDALKTRFGVEIPVPATPPSIKLNLGDGIIVMAVSGLPRLTDRHEYTSDEIAGAKFRFALWTCNDPQD